MREIKGIDKIWYLYDNVGMVGFELNGTSYYYVRNLQGDVTAIVNTSGTTVVTYSYDSWGKVLSVSGSSASTVGALNPIRYRGYYYDTETNLYYLNSRYYDPETGRFLSTDVVAEGGNLYTYCQNDPINRSDESGYLSTFWTRVIKIAIGVVAVTAAVAITVATGGAAAPIIAAVIASTLIGAGVNAGIAALTGGDVGEAAIDGMVDGFMFGGICALGGAAIAAIKAGGQGISAVSSATTKVVKNKNAVIGKLDDLKTIGNNEYTLLDQMPNKGSPKLNWKQNSGVLRKEMSRGISIRDASAYDYTVTNTGFLRAERETLKNFGWKLIKGFWVK